jgi:hypothetical protein
LDCRPGSRGLVARSNGQGCPFHPFFRQALEPAIAGSTADQKSKSRKDDAPLSHHADGGYVTPLPMFRHPRQLSFALSGLGNVFDD